MTISRVSDTLTGRMAVMMKRKLCSLCLIVLLSLGASCSHPVEKKRDVAAVSLVTGNVISFVVGAPLALFGLESMGLVGKRNKRNKRNKNNILLLSLTTALGFVLMDENRQMLVYSSLDKKTARQIGLSEVERKAYNDELALINLISDEMHKQAEEKKEHHKELPPEEVVAWAKKTSTQVPPKLG